MFDNALRIHVHEDGRALDGMFRLVELAKEQRPIEDTLSAMCRLIAELAGVEVVSVYLRERQLERDALVMRGNIGFPADAVGRVQLGMDEGLTGVVAKRCRPVSVAVAQQDTRYKHVDGIGEEKFAAYLGVPLLVRGEVAGVLVLQRQKPSAFTESDVALASSVAAPLIFVIEKTGATRGEAAHQRFSGTSIVRGRAIGRAVVLPPVSAAPVSEIAALHALEFDVVTVAQRLGQMQPSVARSLDNLALVAIALREQVSAPVGDVLTRLQRAPYRSSAQDRDLGELVDERRREVTDLWRFLVADMQHRLSICGSVLVVPSLGTFLALEAVARGAAAVVIGGSAEPGARDVLEAARLPAVAGVPELVARVRPGDTLDVDGGRGTVSSQR